jgi:gliding motility-associated-like protein
MKKNNLFFFFLLAMLCQPFFCFAQPSNDNCSTAVDLGKAPVCLTTVYSNVSATTSVIGAFNVPSCFVDQTKIERDVWFTFTADNTILDYTILIEGVGATPLKNPQVAFYRGDCGVDGLDELACKEAVVGINELKFSVVGLTPGLPYFIRVSDFSANATPNAGDFTVCVKEIEKLTINSGGSTASSGDLYDSGGPLNDYKVGENYVYTICPTAPHQCIQFTLDYYNIDNSGNPFFGGAGDWISFFGGKDTTDTKLINQISSSADNDGGGGGVCFMVSTSETCMTIQFKSDSLVELEGFKGHWTISDKPCPKLEPIEVDVNVGEKELLANLSTSASLVTLKELKCPKGSYGTFLADDKTNLGLGKGIILTSGDAEGAARSNDMINFTGEISGNPGDADLDTLSSIANAGSSFFPPSNDACIVDLEIFAATDQISFEYLFGSDEYPEFANSSFNDIFAFLVSGPGIVGNPAIGNQKNIAVLPNSNTPVEINSVNNLVNWQFYRNNFGGSSVQYDGLIIDSLGYKKSLTAVANVQPCQTYRLKLAVADRGDTAYDSGVFVSEIKGSSPKVSLLSKFGLNYLIEKCSGEDDKIKIVLDKALTKDMTFKIKVAGSATRDLDYNLGMPNVVTFFAGETEKTFPFFPIADNIIEGEENITISLSRDFGCGEITLTTLDIKINDQVKIDLNLGKDTILICGGGEGVKVKATGAEKYIWSPTDGVSDITSPKPILNPTKSQWYVVTGKVGTCIGKDSVYAQVFDPNVKIIALDPLTFCQGDSIHVKVTGNVSTQDLKWGSFSSAAFPLPKGSDVYLKPAAGFFGSTSDFWVTAKVAGCIVGDTIKFDGESIQLPASIVSDTVVCLGKSLKIANPILFDDGSGTIYTWTPTTGLSGNVKTTGVTAKPKISTNYILDIKSPKGYCHVSDTVKITVPLIDVLETSPLKLCKGDTLTLNCTVTPTNYPFKWSSNTKPIIFSPTATQTKVIPTKGGYIRAALTGKCKTVDSVLVVLDSLPNLTISQGDTIKNHCKGDIIELLSAPVNTGVYPSMTYSWTPNNETTLNAKVTLPSGTTIYKRTTKNGLCTKTNDISITAIEPPILALSLSKAGLCEDDTIQIILKGTASSFKWEGPTAGSVILNKCLDPNNCTNPSVIATGLYTVYATAGTCKVSDTITVNPIECAVELPTIFVPDGTDALNKHFNIIPNKATVLQFRVFNRWGQVVYNNNDPTTGWNGNLLNNGEALPSDVYIYSIEVRYADGTTELKKGDVTLLR